MPCLNKLNLMIAHNALNLTELSWRKSVVVLQANWRQPELRSFAFPSHVNMDWLAAIT